METSDSKDCRTPASDPYGASLSGSRQGMRTPRRETVAGRRQSSQAGFTRRGPCCAHPVPTRLVERLRRPGRRTSGRAARHIAKGNNTVNGDVRHASHPRTSMRGRRRGASVDAATCVLRLGEEQARDVSRSVSTCLNQVRDCRATRVVIDMSDVHRLDFSGFGVLLAKLRDVLRVTVLLNEIGVSEATSLRSMGLLDGVTVKQRSVRHRGVRAGSDGHRVSTLPR